MRRASGLASMASRRASSLARIATYSPTMRSKPTTPVGTRLRKGASRASASVLNCFAACAWMTRGESGKSWVGWGGRSEGGGRMEDPRAFFDSNGHLEGARGGGCAATTTRWTWTHLRETVGSEVVVHQRGDVPARYPVGAGVRRRGRASGRGAHRAAPRVVSRAWAKYIEMANCVDSSMNATGQTVLNENHFIRLLQSLRVRRVAVAYSNKEKEKQDFSRSKRQTVMSVHTKKTWWSSARC